MRHGTIGLMLDERKGRAVMPKTVWYRIKNVLLAFLVFIVMIELPTLTSGVVLGVIEGIALRDGGTRAVAEAYLFLMDNLNLFSAVVYALFGLPVLVWVLLMRRRARRVAAAPGVVPAPATVPALAPAPAPVPAPAAPVLRSPQPEQVSFRIHGLPNGAWLDAVLLAVGMQFLTTFVMVLILLLLPAAMEEYQNLIQGSGIDEYGIMWFISTVVLPPLVEETGFRGLGLTYLKRAGVPFAVANVLQALAFGLFHGNLVQGIYTFMLALFMGYVVHKTGSVMPAMLLHAVYNLMGTLGVDVIAALVPWLPYGVELVLGLCLTILAMLSLRDRGVRTGSRAA